MAFFAAFFRYLVNRLNERASWGVIVPVVAGVVGAKVSPENAAVIGEIATAAALALPAAMPDGQMPWAKKPE